MGDHSLGAVGMSQSESGATVITYIVRSNRETKGNPESFKRQSALDKHCVFFCAQMRLFYAKYS